MERIQIKTNFLQNAAVAIPCTNYHQQLLQSYYLTRMQKFGSKHFANTDQHNQSRCNKCLTKFTGDKFKMKVQPIRCRRKRYKKLVDAYESKKILLSKSKQILAAKYQKLVHNTMILTCLVCKNPTKTIIRKISKPKIEITKRQSSPIMIEETIKMTPVSKKRKKDKFAGLNVDAVLKNRESSTLNQAVSIQSLNNNRKIATKPNEAQPPSAIGKKPKKKMKTQSIINAEKYAIAKKKKNNLIQLANALKIQQRKTVGSGIRIEQLLK